MITDVAAKKTAFVNAYVIAHANAIATASIKP